jgi:tetratricopeptide (TPR) repeat protein
VSRPRVSACLIVRDEEQFIGGCLDSLAGHVDEVVLVDTGSRDRTIEIAKDHGVLLLERKWREDFAWARNEGLAAASGDWILYIDADERLSIPDDADLRDNLGTENAFAALVLFRPTVNSTLCREYRLFRNDPRLRFRGSMHETILPDLGILQESIGALTVLSPVLITHLGYEPGSEWKHERNLPLLRSAIAQDPDRLYYWFHLAATLEALGRVDEALEAGAEGLRRAVSLPPESVEHPVASLIAARQANLLHQKGLDSGPAIAAGHAYKADNPALLLLEAKILLDQQRIEPAVAILEKLASVDSEAYLDGQLGFDRRIFDVYAPDLLGVALLRLGRRDEAAASFARAAAAAPDDPSYRIKAQALGARI